MTSQSSRVLCSIAVNVARRSLPSSMAQVYDLAAASRHSSDLSPEDRTAKSPRTPRSGQERREGFANPFFLCSGLGDLGDLAVNTLEDLPNRQIRASRSRARACPPVHREHLDVHVAGRDGDVAGDHDRAAVRDVHEAEGVAELVRDDDRARGGVVEAAVDEDLAALAVVEAEEVRGRVAEQHGDA